MSNTTEKRLLPVRFTPFLRPMVWGGRQLGDVLGKTLPTSAPYGESWDLSHHSLHQSKVASGPFEGKSISELMEKNRAAILGAAAERYLVFPWLVKFLDAWDWLSVQVHPDGEAVQRLWPGEGSKTEAWFILDCAPGGLIYAGLLPGVTEKDLRAALSAGTVADCLHRFKPRPGDCIFLPAGTVHAVGGGVLFAEVQQTSDATFRLFDWNRRDEKGNSRTLHIEEAFACIDWQKGPVSPTSAAGFSEDSANGHDFRERRKQSLVRCPFFHLDYLQASDRISLESGESMQVVLVLKGTGHWEGNYEEEVKTGQVWLLPAQSGPPSLRPEPNLKLLVSTLPM